LSKNIVTTLIDAFKDVYRINFYRLDHTEDEINL